MELIGDRWDWVDMWNLCEVEETSVRYGDLWNWLEIGGTGRR